MKKLGWVVIILLAGAWLGPAALAEGISAEREQQIIRDVLSIYEPLSSSLAAGDESVTRKCGTPIVVEIPWLWSRFSPETRARLSQYFEERPADLPLHYDTPDGLFRIHYDVAGIHAVDMSHGVDGNGVPIYVTTCGEVLTEVRQKEIDDLGYPVPPKDGFYPQGGTDAYDVYLHALGSSFLGLAYPDSIYRGGPNNLFIATSYFLLDNDYVGYPGYEDDEWREIMSVTAAHEYFHAIQFGIDYSEFWEDNDDTEHDFWWHEMSSTWMEDVVYDDVNDYYAYLRFFFDQPNWALTTQARSGPKGFYPYGACIWLHFLTERFGNDIMKDIWMQCGQEMWFNTIEAWSDQIATQGSSLHEELGLFRLWCYFAGDRYRSFSFEEGQNYPTLDESKFVTWHSSYPVDEEMDNDTIKPEYLGTAYLQFETPIVGPVQDFKVKISHDLLDLWTVTAAGLSDLVDPQLVSTRNITQPLVLPDWQNYESVVVMVTPFSEAYREYKNLPGQNFFYEVSDTLPSNEDNEILLVRPNPYNLDDGLLFIPVQREARDETEVFFYSAAGELVRGGRNEIVDGKTPYYIEQGAGSPGKTFTWNGRNTGGEKVATGVYVCLVRLGDQKSLQKIAVFRK